MVALVYFVVLKTCTTSLAWVPSGRKQPHNSRCSVDRAAVSVLLGHTGLTQLGGGELEPQ